MSDNNPLKGRQRRLRKLAMLATADVSMAAKLVHATLAALAGEADEVVYPGPVKLADALNVEHQTVTGAIKDLIAAGLLHYGGEPIRGVRLRFEAEGDQDAQAEVWRSLADAAGAAVRAAGDTKGSRSKANKEAHILGSGLTEQERLLVCSSVEVMRTYILYGSAGVRDPSCRKATQLNWLTVEGITDEDLKLDKWTRHQLAGFWWYVVSTHRQKRGIPLALPRFPRLLSDLKQLPWTNQQIYDYMHYLFTNYDRICELYKGIQPPPLDEFVFSDNLLQRKVEQVRYGNQKPSEEE